MLLPDDVYFHLTLLSCILQPCKFDRVMMCDDLYRLVSALLNIVNDSRNKVRRHNSQHSSFWHDNLLFILFILYTNNKCLITKLYVGSLFIYYYLFIVSCYLLSFLMKFVKNRTNYNSIRNNYLHVNIFLLLSYLSSMQLI